MTPNQFIELVAQGYNRIPVVREILADLDTPLTTYLKLANQPYSFLLESVVGGEKWGRYSVIGLPCKTRVKIEGYDIEVITNDQVVESHRYEDPLMFVSEYMSRFRVPDIEGLPRFNGGLVGYFGYDTVRYVEPHLSKSVPIDTINTPDVLLLLSDEVVVFDNLSGALMLLVHADASEENALDKAYQRLETLEKSLAHSLSADDVLQPLKQYQKEDAESVEEGFVSHFGEEAFKSSVDRIKEYIVAGDIMQAVISQRLHIPFKESPLSLYRALRCLNPSPYMYLLNMGDFHIVGSSPEILARAEDGEATVRPLAGTRPRGKTPHEDLELEKELLADEKEIAEHLMLIDLGRNDIGRISKIGSVKVTDQMAVERYSHVMHIVSNVCGQVDPNFSAMDVLRATLPAGTLSGAPKIRAMEILDELEPVKRGIYGGAVGYLAWNGNIDTAIAIRTAVIKDGSLYVQAGAGVVADSVAQKEWDETMNKARAIFRAVAMVQRGLTL